MKLRDFGILAAHPLELAQYVKIQEPGGLIEFERWSHIIEFLNTILSDQLVIVLKAKQIGISWALALYALWYIYITPAGKVLMISKGEREAKELLAKCKALYDSLPKEMWVDHTAEPSSTLELGFKEMKSKITALPSVSEAGIGETAGLVIHDEFDFHEYGEINLGHTLPTVADSPERKLVIVSTVDPETPDSDFKNLYKSASKGLNGFTSRFYGVFSRPDRTEEWYAQESAKYSLEPGKMQRNYPKTEEEALSPLSAQSCFNKDRLLDLWNNAISPKVRRNYIYILHPPRVGVVYTAGVDVGEGVGLDYSSLTIIGRYGLEKEVCAQIYTNTLGTDLFAQDVNDLCVEYKSPKLVIDNIGIGRAVIDKLVELGYTNLYKQDSKKDKIGWNLTRPNKRELVVKLVESINNGSLITRFKPQIQELMEYQWINGYPEPTGKTHGDTVISLMLANEIQKNAGIQHKINAYFPRRRQYA